MPSKVYYSLGSSLFGWMVYLHDGPGVPTELGICSRGSNFQFVRMRDWEKV